MLKYKMSRYIGDIVEINPLWEDINLLFITTTNSKFSLDIKKRPLSLFIYENDIYFCLCEYEFNFLESFEDFRIDDDQYFNSFDPDKSEFEYLKKLLPTYYKLNYNETLKGNLDDFTESELELIKEWNRELNLYKLLS